MSKIIPIGEVLKEYGYITDEELSQALAEQKKDGKRRLGTVLLDMGFVTEGQILDAMGKKLGCKVIDLDATKVNPKVVGKLPRQLAEKYCALVIDTAGGRLIVAVSDPLNLYAIEDIRQITGAQLEIVLAESDQIKRAIDYNYTDVNARSAAMAADTLPDASYIPPKGVFEDFETDSDVPVVKLINSLLVKACSSGASDVHIEPFENSTSVRMRIDGVVLDYVDISAAVHAALISRLKIMANLDIAEKRLPQEGHFKTVIEGYVMNVRVSVIPTVFGEKAALRFLSNEVVSDTSGRFGMSDENSEKFLEMLRSPGGMIYITGPSGSGKTTTLYMALEHLAKQQVNISTIEDPVERAIPRVNQMQVNNQAGLTFEKGLRALLRQDPDIIMLGETRDEETAQISVRAAVSGHLVLSTLHTGDAVSSIIRLREMGIPEYMISATLVGVVAQRLVRRICPNCGYYDTPTKEELAALGGREVLKIRRSRGCSQCNNSGYKGRTSIHEMITVDSEIRRMITDNAPREEIEEYAKNVQGMKPLKESAAELVSMGITSVEELLRVTYSVD
ncbi:MAG: GspE/PulE family protein [Huintestinicola sp.]|uniref:GspE/PulE family protein n=1 Tax=Huintestinicola sp. TaxID=2981661 RepID=UPI003F046FEE